MLKVAVIAHETHFTMELLNEIMLQNDINNVYFVPIRERISKNGQLPVAPKGLKIYRDNDKYKKLVSKSSQIIFTFSLHDEFIAQLLCTPASNHPKIIILLSRTPLNDYLNLSKTNKSKLSSIKFVSFWNSELKFIDSHLGVGESLVKVFKTLNINKNSNIVLAGYGTTGSGIAEFLNDDGYYNIMVNDINLVRSVIAKNSGLKTASLDELAKDADVLIDATGDSSEYLNKRVLDLFHKKKVTIISSSTKLGIKAPNGYVNKNGTVFHIDQSRGMINMSHDIGGSSHHFMRVTGLTVLYFCLKYHKIYDNINKYISPYERRDHVYKKDSLYILNDSVERQIAKYVLKNNDIFGGPAKQFYASNYLSVNELKREIVNKIGIHQSLHSPNRMYKIYYNHDGSFTMDTKEDGSILGTTTGTYKIIKNSNYDIGFIDVTYTKIFESPYIESFFHKNHPYSVFKTMRNLLGPFTVTQKSGDHSVILRYKNNDGLIYNSITLFQNSS
jgi:uncharacterized protein